jgi:hypothetical protein
MHRGRSARALVAIAACVVVVSAAPADAIVLPQPRVKISLEPTIGPGSGFGMQVAASGNRAIVYGPDQLPSLIYEKTHTGWVQTASLATGDPNHHASAVAIQGSTAAIEMDFTDPNDPSSNQGGLAQIYNRHDTNGQVQWTPTAIIGIGTGNPSALGASVGAAISGSRVVLATTNFAAVFVKTNFGWESDGNLIPTDTTGQAGAFDAVAMNGNTIVLGAAELDGPNFLYNGTGVAYVFQRLSTGIWTQTAELAPSGLAAGDEFGASVSISGKTVVVGAPAHGGPGSAFVFTEKKLATDTYQWTQSAEVAASDGAANDAFGDGVALDGSRMAIGADSHDASIGAVYLFKRTSTGWAEYDEIPSADAATGGNRFGNSVSLSGSTLAIGEFNGGAAWVYQ